MRSDSKSVKAGHLSANTLGVLLEHSVDMSLDLYPEMKMDIVSEDEESDVDFDNATDITEKQSLANSVAVSDQFEKAGTAALNVGSESGSDIANLEDLYHFFNNIEDEGLNASAWSDGAHSVNSAETKQNVIIETITEIERYSFLKFSPAGLTVGTYSNKSEGQKNKYIECLTLSPCLTITDNELKIISENTRNVSQKTLYCPIGTWGYYERCKLGPATWRIESELEDYANDWKEVDLYLEYNGAKMGSKGIIAALAHNAIRMTKSWSSLYFNATRTIILSENAVANKSEKEKLELAQKYESIVFNYKNEPDQNKYVIAATYARKGTGTLRLYETFTEPAPRPAKSATVLVPKFMVTGLPSKLVLKVCENIKTGIKTQHKSGLPKFDIETIGFKRKGPAAVPIKIKTCIKQNSWKYDNKQKWSSNSCWKAVLPQSRYGDKCDSRYLAASIPVMLALMHANDSQPTEYETIAKFCKKLIKCKATHETEIKNVVARAIGHIHNRVRLLVLTAGIN